jgi:hypothetical protein
VHLSAAAPKGAHLCAYRQRIQAPKGFMDSGENQSIARLIGP